MIYIGNRERDNANKLSNGENEVWFDVNVMQTAAAHTHSLLRSRDTIAQSRSENILDPFEFYTEYMEEIRRRNG